MSIKLFVSAIAKFLLGVLLVGVLVFLPAGTLDFTGGIIFMSVLFIPMFIAGIVMMVKSPSLLKKRLDAKEEGSNIDAILDDFSMEKAVIYAEILKPKYEEY